MEVPRRRARRGRRSLAGGDRRGLHRRSALPAGRRPGRGAAQSCHRPAPGRPGRHDVGRPVRRRGGPMAGPHLGRGTPVTRGRQRAVVRGRRRSTRGTGRHGRRTDVRGRPGPQDPRGLRLPLRARRAHRGGTRERTGPDRPPPLGRPLLLHRPQPMDGHARAERGVLVPQPPWDRTDGGGGTSPPGAGLRLLRGSQLAPRSGTGGTGHRRGHGRRRRHRRRHPAPGRRRHTATADLARRGLGAWPGRRLAHPVRTCGRRPAHLRVPAPPLLAPGPFGPERPRRGCAGGSRGGVVLEGRRQRGPGGPGHFPDGGWPGGRRRVRRRRAAGAGRLASAVPREVRRRHLALPGDLETSGRHGP